MPAAPEISPSASDGPSQPARRRLLAGAGSLGLLGATHAASAQPAPANRSRPTLTAQTTEGPYYFDPGLVRADITEGTPGVPLAVRFAIVDETGAPFAGARVDIWHCNAEGFYSGYASQGENRRADMRGRTFLRGTQATGADGVATFSTIYPGWYPGRTTHIHFKVFHGARNVLTCQFFLPDALSEFLYTQVPAYRRASLRDTLNSNDGIRIEAGETVLGDVRDENSRYVATLNVAVDRNGNPRTGHPPRGDRTGPPPGPPPMVGPLTGTPRVEALVPGLAVPGPPSRQG